MKTKFKRLPAKLSQKLTEWLNNWLDDTHNHYSCFLPDRLGPFSSLILRLFYSGIRVANNQAQIVQLIEKDAIIVYGTKFTNYFELLFYYSRFRKLGLPYPQICFDYKVFIWQPMSRLLKILVAHLDFFFRNFKLPDPYKSGYIRQELIDGRCGYLSLVGKKVFYRRFVKAKADPIRYLKDRLKKIADTGSQMYKRKEIERKEALNKASYQNAIDFFTSRGVKGSDNTDEIEFYAQVIKRALKYLQT